MGERVVPCVQGGDLCCMEDQDDPCFVPFIGPSKRPVSIRYSARFTEQVRTLSGDRRWPLALAPTQPGAPRTETANETEGGAE